MAITQSQIIPTLYNVLEIIMKWSKPAFTDLRFGFEITMYIANR